MVLTRVDASRSLSDRVFEAIQDAIMSGDLPAGSPLRVQALADQVGTSVMPVREAIRRLEESGLALREPHRGAMVRELTMPELLHVYEVRILLETAAARRGAPATQEADHAALHLHLRTMQDAVARHDEVAALDADEALLGTVYDAGGNPVLAENIRALWRRCRPYKILGARRALASADERLWSYQPQLVEAACAHDADAAARLTGESLNGALTRIRAMFSTP